MKQANNIKHQLRLTEPERDANPWVEEELEQQRKELKQESATSVRVDKIPRKKKPNSHTLSPKKKETQLPNIMDLLTIESQQMTMDAPPRKCFSCHSRW